VDNLGYEWALLAYFGSFDRPDPGEAAARSGEPGS